MFNSGKQRSEEIARLREKLAKLEELRKKDAHFRTLVEATSDWIWEISAEGVYTYSSPQVESILGYTPEDVIGKRPFDMMPPAEAKRIEAVFKDLVEKSEPIVELENTVIHKDGRLVVLETSGLPFFDKNGKLEGYRGIDRDITSRKRAETALAREKELSDAMLDGLPGVFYVFDPNGRFLRWNRNLEIISGYTTDEISQMTSDLFFPEEERPAVREAIGRVFTEGWATVEANFLSKDGSTAPYLMTGAHIAVDGNSYLAGLGMDISERKQAEQEKLILERQVQHAQKLESLGIMAGGIAHDFNNLLMGIMGNVDLVLMDLSPDDLARKRIQEIEISARRLADLTAQMLAYSGKGKFIIQTIDFQTLIREMVDLLDISRSKKANLRYEFDENARPIEADSTQIRQVVMNLVVNASEAIGDAKGKIVVRTGTMWCDKDYLEQTYLDDDLIAGDYSFFEVSDTGQGMNEVTIAKIFDPFFSTKFTGRGLGLAAVLGIVRGHGGTIKVYSEPGRGTTIRVLFPASRGPVSSQNESALPDNLEILEGKTVMLVDDEEVIRNVGRSMLERLGMNVISAEDGERALALYKDNHKQVDFVILDLTMPQMDGEETFHQIRRVDREACVLLSSGYSQQELSSRYATQPLAGFIQKPYQIHTLGASLLKALEMVL